MEAGSYLHHRRYRIRQPLGRGGMGAVYLAEDLNLAGRLVAVKENLNNSEEAQRQFRREAVLLAHLRHPNLPQVIDYFLDESGRQYLVMEYVPGENMQEALASNGALPLAEALNCMDQVLQAVAYMHHQRDPATGRSRAIIHRDIKPANIKRTPEGRYLLVDFGIAKVQSQTAAATAVSARALTPGYAPIEQYHGGTDERSDVYALGATLYALVTGKAPPSATNMASGAPLPPPRSYNSKVPAAVSKVIERAMRMAVQDRYQRVTEMYAALFNRPMPTAPGTVGAAAAQRKAPRPDRTTMLVGGALAIVSVLAIWVLLASSGSSSDSSAIQTPSTTLPAVAAAPATATASTASTATPIEIVEGAALGTAPVMSTATSTATEEPTVAVALMAPDATVDSTATAMTPSTPTPTPSPSPTPNATVVAAASATVDDAIILELPTRPPTSTRIPTATPVATATAPPTGTPTRTPPSPAAGATPRIAVAGSAISTVDGPRAATILQPADNASSNTPTVFSWRADAELAPGQEFEVVFWNPLTQSISQAAGWVRSGTATSTMIPADKKSPGTYNWALFLVLPEPYHRLRMLAGPFTFSIPGSGGESRPNSGPGDPTPYPPAERP